MNRLTEKQCKGAMARDGRTLMVTYLPDGSIFALDNGVGVAKKAALAMTQGELFTNAPGALVPNEDGLFPGFTQTWRAQ